MFYRLDDAVMRINNSVIHYRQRPVFIESTYRRKGDQKIAVDFIDLLSQKRQKGVAVECGLFNSAAFEVGYVNSDTIGAIYVERRAVRRVKEGLSGYNVIAGVRDTMNKRLGGDTPVPEDLLISESLGKTIINEYPDLDNALKTVMLRKGDNSNKVAFNRSYAFLKDRLGLVKLLYKDVEIGWVSEDSGKIRLADDKLYMKEELTFKGIENYGT